MPRVTARAPTRIDFGGGWTDVPPYSDQEGGSVCNIAISRYATVTVDTDLHSKAANDPLTKAALQRSPFPHAHVTASSHFPVSAGLGGSSAAGVALAGALAALEQRTLSRYDLAMLSRTTEVDELGIPGGYQDHFAASYGGALLLNFSAAGIGVTELPLTRQFTQEFEQRAVLVYTGESRISGATITAVRDAYLANVPQTLDALMRMKTLAVEMAGAIRRDSLDDLARLVGEHWIHQRSLHPAVSTATIDEIMRVAANAGSPGGKALGASGGGCVVCFAGEGREAELQAALAPLGEILSFTVDPSGFQIS